MLVDELAHDGVATLPGCALIAIGPDAVVVHSMKDGAEREILADSVVICAGYQASDDKVEWLRQGVPDLQVIGDAKIIDHAMEGIAAAYDVALAI